MTERLVDVSIVLVSWNTRQLLLDCLSALPASSGSLHTDVWVVDNHSSDGSVEAVRAQFPQVNIIANTENRGFAAANNQGITASKGRYLLLLNTDTIPDAGAIEQLVRFAEARPRAAMVGARMRNPDGSFQGSFADFPSLKNELLGVTKLGAIFVSPIFPAYSDKQSRVARQVDWINGACMLVRRTAVGQVGIMEEQFFMYSEEPDWCIRMKRAGWEVWYCPDAEILHYGGQSTSQRSGDMFRVLYRSKVRFVEKHYGAWRAGLMRLMLLILLRLRWLYYTVRSAGNTQASTLVRWNDLV